MSENLIEKAKLEFENNNLDSSLSLIRKILATKLDFDDTFIISALLIDIGSIKFSSDLIQEGINLLESLDDSEEKYKNIYYNLANGYAALFKIKSSTEPTYHFFNTETELDIAIDNYRKYLELFPNSPEGHVNLGNMFDASFRKIDALDCYENALNLEENHSLALFNKGITLYYYASFTDCYLSFYKESYDCFIESKKRGFPLEFENIFKKYMDYLEPIIKNNEVLDKSLNSCEIKFINDVLFKFKNIFKKYIKNINDKHFLDKSFIPNNLSFDNEFEEYLIRFCFEHKLYLNLCNFCQKCENSVGDNLFFRRMEYKINYGEDIIHNSTANLISYFNQIKQDYVTSRFLLILSRYDGYDLSFLDKNVKLMDTLEYKEYNIYIQLLMFSFKSMHDVLDKIAFFINDYLNIGLNEDFVTFNRLWYKNKKTRNVYNTIIQTENPYLNALFRLYVDLDSHENMNEFRNAITHRFLEINMFPNNDNSFSEHELEKCAIELTKFVRNAIIYLVMLIEYEENRKFKNMKSKDVGIFKTIEIPDEFKSFKH